MEENIMADDFLERIKYQVEHKFYYIEYPNGVTKDIWKDREGERHDMQEMGLDHLKASIRLLKNNRDELKDSNAKGSPVAKKVKEALLPLIDKKLRELEDNFKKKADAP